MDLVYTLFLMLTIASLGLLIVTIILGGRKHESIIGIVVGVIGMIICKLTAGILGKFGI